MDSEILSNIHHPTLTYPKKRDADVRAFFQRFMLALQNRDSESFAGLWATPSLLVSDRDARAMLSLKDFLGFLDGVEGFDAKPDILQVDWKTDRMALAHVKIGRNASTYVIRYDPWGRLKLHFALIEH